MVNREGPNGGWIVFDPIRDTSLARFVEVARPSVVMKENCYWICVRGRDRREARYTRGEDYSSYNEVLESQQALANLVAKKKEAPQAVAKLLKIAEERGEVSGKWLLMAKGSENVDEMWRRVGISCGELKLGVAAKISPYGGNNGTGRAAVCCVYVENFTDRKELRRVCVEIRAVLGFDEGEGEGEGEKVEKVEECWNVGFKPDVFTRLGIESNNVWGLPATTHKEKEVLEWV